MGLMERLQEIAKVLPENELAEVIGFAEALKARRGATRIAAPNAAIDVELMHAVRSRCEGGFTWRREELYDRGIR
ncbi:MAG: DUF2281 domain-containing protein [Candidatus Accumulibacter phosphatis]|nr:DUF2281 domain-containing protein [Candidatus Accumulibacter phosphatis]